jgi:hypothetical protein
MACPSIVSMAPALMTVTRFVGQRHFPGIVSMAPAQFLVEGCVEQYRPTEQGLV